MNASDNLLCVARLLAGDYHSGGTGEFKTTCCQSCNGYTFCKRIQRLLKREVKREQIQNQEDALPASITSGWDKR